MHRLDRTWRLLSMGLWLMSAFIRDVPVELEEAARVDGCGPAGVFFRVVLPADARRVIRR